MKIEVGDKLWFGEEDDGFTDSLVVEHIMLSTDEHKKLKEIFKNDIDEINKVDAIIFLKNVSKRSKR